MNSSQSAIEKKTQKTASVISTAAVFLPYFLAYNPYPNIPYTLKYN